MDEMAPQKRVVMLGREGSNYPSRSGNFILVCSNLGTAIIDNSSTVDDG